MTDSYHFESVPKFRVGGVYRKKDGELVGLRLDKHNPQPGTAWAHLVDTEWGDGFRCLTTGADTVQLEGGVRDLIPGELVQRDGQWIPLEQTASLIFPSGSSVQLAGDKITGRIAPEPIRPALDWNTATPFDTFTDFIVTKGEVPTAPLHTSPTTDSAYPAIAGLLRG